ARSGWVLGKKDWASDTTNKPKTSSRLQWNPIGMPHILPMRQVAVMLCVAPSVPVSCLCVDVYLLEYVVPLGPQLPLDRQRRSQVIAIDDGDEEHCRVCLSMPDVQASGVEDVRRHRRHFAGEQVYRVVEPDP